MYLVARNLACPGFSTLLSNLLSTSRDIPTPTTDLVPCMGSSNSTRLTETPWLEQYHKGRKMDMYSIVLPKSFHGVSFGECAKRLYEEHDLLAFALFTDGTLKCVDGMKNDSKTDQSHNFSWLLAPFYKDVTVSQNSLVFVICNEIPSAFSMFSYDHILSSVSRMATRKGSVEETASTSNPYDFAELANDEELEVEADDGVGPGLELEDHIVVVGSDSGTSNLLEVLGTLPNPVKNVVFIHSQSTLSSLAAATATEFTITVHHVFGLGVDNVRELLVRANVMKARAVYIRRGDNTDKESNPWSVIVSPVKTALMLESLIGRENKHLMWCADVYSSSNGEFMTLTLQQRTDATLPFACSPALASGTIVDYQSWYNALRSQTVFKPFLLPLLDSLLRGQTVLVDGKYMCAGVELVALPDDPPRTFGELLLSQLTQGALVLGLFRLRGSFLGFVFTNPPADTELDQDDRMYIIRPWAWRERPAKPSQSECASQSDFQEDTVPEVSSMVSRLGELPNTPEDKTMESDANSSPVRSSTKLSLADSPSDNENEMLLSNRSGKNNSTITE